jgi:serine/threonine-protein kinase
MTEDSVVIRRVRELFDEVMDQSPDERQKMLKRICTYERPEVARQVEALITTESETGALPGFKREWDPDIALGMIGHRLGAYEVTRHIGNGGMGAVYEAVRADDQYRKRVAVKLVHRGLDSQVTLTRFRRERQILANLEHPNISRLLDGGVSADGRPFLVMENVDGSPITTWCAEKNSSTEQRLRLFLQVCDAVQHAHSNLVVHLDLKPGNILVTPEGTVKLLDFGIARLLGGEDDAMPATRGARAFTPEYASPEHIRGEPLTTASDVYSLGVVLFEMLTGKRPKDGAPKLRGDVGAIVMVALRPEPQRRYASVEALRADISRYLSKMPIRARPDRAVYRIDKFIRRNLVGVGMSVLVVMALAGGIAATALQARIAEAEQSKAEELSGFLRSLLSSVRPASEGSDVTVTQVLESAARRIDNETLRPSVRADLESVIGQSYLSLGKYDEALRHFTRSQSLWEFRFGPASIQSVAAMQNIGSVYLATGQLDRAEAVFTKALATWRELNVPSDAVEAAILRDLATIAARRRE